MESGWWPVVLAGLLLGLSGAVHCAGMCGGFPLALAALPGGYGPRLRRVTLYNFGRGATYTLLAGFAGAAGVYLGGASGLADAGGWAARGLSMAVGAALILTALWLLGVKLPLARHLKNGFLAEQVIGLGRSLVRSEAAAAPFALGLLNGLLPCPLVWMMLLASFYSGSRGDSPLLGVALGGSFALGTMPIMIGMGALGAAFPRHVRTRVLRAAAVLLLAMGAVTIARGVPQLDPWLHFGHESHLHGEGSP